MVLGVLAFELTVERVALVVNTIIALAAVVALILTAVSVAESRRAILAANRALDVQSAALDFDFKCSVSLPENPTEARGLLRRGHIMLGCRGARLFVHNLTVAATYEGMADGFTLQMAQEDAPAASSESLPHQLFPGDWMTFRWPKLTPTKNRLIQVNLRIAYSFDPERGPVHEREMLVGITYFRGSTKRPGREVAAGDQPLQGSGTTGNEAVIPAVDEQAGP